MEDEKKFKLDELPDKGSNSEAEVKIKPIRASRPEPRVEKLKAMSASQKVETLTQRWHFDKPVQKWGWLVALAFLLVLEKSGHWAELMANRAQAAEKSGGLTELFHGDTPFHFLFKHPLVFAVFIPVLFKFKESSLYYFEITFDGINAVKDMNLPPQAKPHRIKIKWDEISAVTHEKLRKRDILVLHSHAGPIAHLIWDIDEVKKKVIKQVVKGLVSNKNAFRIFMEKEVA